MLAKCSNLEIDQLIHLTVEGLHSLLELLAYISGLVFRGIADTLSALTCSGSDTYFQHNDTVYTMPPFFSGSSLCVLFCFVSMPLGSLAEMSPVSTSDEDIPLPSNTSRTAQPTTRSLQQPRKLSGAETFVPTIFDFKDVVILEYSGSGTLNCSAKGKPKPNIYWILRGKTTVKSEPSTTNETETFETNTLVLEVNGTNGGGTYVCLAINTVGNASSTAKVHVKLKVALSWVRRESTCITVTCRAYGYPYPSIALTFPNDTVKLQQSEAINENAVVVSLESGKDPSVGGQYRCTANNSIGDKATSTTIVNVPTQTIRIKWNKEKLVLSCTVVGHPIPNVTWIFNMSYLESRRPIPNNSKKLLVSTLHPTKAGVYSCLAFNDSANAAQSITVPGPTVTLLNTSVHIHFDDIIQLVCIATGPPLPDIVWLSRHSKSTIKGNETKSEKTRTNSLTVSGKLGGGKYKCRANNSLGLKEKRLSVSVFPHLVERPKTQTVPYEKEATLICAAVGYPVLSISWTRDNKPVENTTIIETDQTDSFVRSTLHIQANHGGGTFRCTATTNNSFEQDFALATVFVGPHIIESACCDDVINATGQTRLTCISVGYPTPSISWIAADSKHAINNISATSFSGKQKSTLVVKGLDGGHYQCIADNNIGSSVVANFTVWVHPYIVTSFKDEQTVTASEYFNPVKCQAIGFPRPVVHWIRRGNKLEYNVSSSYSINRTGSEQTLTLGMVRLHDKGVYTCTATNKVNLKQYQDRKSFYLNVTIDIQFATMSRIADGIAGRSLVLNCSTNGNSKHELSWIDSMQNKKVINSNGSLVSLKFSKLKLRDGNTKYFCLAKNADNTTIKSDSVTVRVLHKAIQFDSKNVFFGEPWRLQCFFKANPRPLSEILKNGKKVNGKVTEIGTNAWRTYLIIKKSKWKLEAAGVYSCSVFFQESPVTVSANAIVRVFPFINNSPLKSSSSEHLPYNINCTASGYPLPTIEWERSINGTIYPIDGIEKRQLRVSDRMLTSILTFNNSSISTAGEYRCRVHSSITPQGRVPSHYRNVSDSVSLQVPSIATILSKTPFTANWGSRLTLRCVATGYPVPNITWMFGGQQILSGALKNTTATSIEEVVHFDNVSAESHGGSYSCLAKNSIGTSASTITVNVPMRVDGPILRGDSKGYVRYGHAFSIGCLVRGYPLSPTQIKRNQQKLVITEKSTSNSLTVALESSRLVFLTIPAANVSVSGSYICKMHLLNGSTLTSSGKVSVKVAPYFVQNVTDMQYLQHSSARLHCSAAGNPRPTITWTFNSSAINLTSTSTRHTNASLLKFLTKSVLTINNVSRTDIGFYRCVASNGLRLKVTSAAAFLDVYYVLVASVRPLSVVLQTNNHSYFTLTCLVMGNPMPNVTWLKKAHLREDREMKLLAPGSRIVSKDNNRVVTFLNISTEDSGDYVCRASNQVGVAASSEVSVTIQGVPTKVDVLSVKDTTDNNVTIQWKRPFDQYSSISHYCIRVEMEGNSTQSKLIKVLGSLSTSFVVSHLKPFSTYHFKVHAVNDIGPGPASDLLRVRTLTSAPGRVGQVNAQVLSSTKIQVSWTRPETPNGNISYYRVYFSAPSLPQHLDSMSQSFKQVSGTALSVNVTGLEKFTEYNLKVAAVNVLDKNYLEGPASNPIWIRTEEDAPSPPMNVNAAMVPDKPSLLNVRWSPPDSPNGNVTGYIILYKKNDSTLEDQPWQSVNVSSSKIQVNITGLTAFTMYVVQVQSITFKPGYVSVRSFAITDQSIPSSPENLQASEKEDRAFRLSWTRPKYPKGAITNYTILLMGSKTYSEGNQTKVVSIKRTKTVRPDLPLTTLLSDLLPDVEYDIEIVAHTVKGEGEPGHISVSTEVSEPAQPQPPVTKIVAHGSTRITVRLVKPSNINGDIKFVDLLVAKLPLGSTAADVDFGLPASETYSTDIALKTPYIAARFDYYRLPETFIIGDNKLYEGYLNGRLQLGYVYAYALRSYTSRNNELLYSTSTASETMIINIESEGSSSTLPLIAVVVAVGFIVVIVQVFLFFLWKRHKRSRADQSSGRSRNSNLDSGLGVNQAGSKRSKDRPVENDLMTSSILYAQFNSGVSNRDKMCVSLGHDEVTGDCLYEQLEMKSEQSSLTYEALADNRQSEYASIDEAKTSF